MRKSLFQTKRLSVFARIYARNDFITDAGRSMAKTGWCVWITGLPGSGKSVVSEALLKLLSKKGIHVQLLSSDVLRKVLTPNPTYSLE